jgi:hypothetical protein
VQKAAAAFNALNKARFEIPRCAWMIKIIVKGKELMKNDATPNVALAHEQKIDASTHSRHQPPRTLSASL